MAELTITTTDGLDGREVTEYLGVVSGEAVIGANVVSDIAAGIRDVVGGGAQFADAVVGATFDYEEMAEGMLWVNLSGTAVKTRRK
ncbi:hypothetical protein BRD15_03325 [Halobacteriales archaeon SW_6_65_15]|nr:MAG: hypothetical protein BRD15_03325 [Halobacteriales archaeon SW_6_65_15]